MQLLRKCTYFRVQPLYLLLLMNALLLKLISFAHGIFHLVFSALQFEILLVQLQLSAHKLFLQLGNHFFKLSLLVIGFKHVNISVQFPIMFLSLCKFGLNVGHLLNSLLVDLADSQVTLQLLNCFLLFLNFFIKSINFILCLLLSQVQLIFQLFDHVVLLRTRNELL